MLLVSDGSSTPPIFTPFPCFHKSLCAFLTLVEQNSCQSSAHSDCVHLNCQCPAVRNGNQSLRCGVLSGQGHHGVNCKKHHNVHLPGMVLYIVCLFSVLHWSINWHRPLHTLSLTLP